MSASTEDIEIELLLEALFQRYHYDFRHYARASIKRRLAQAGGNSHRRRSRRKSPDSTG